MVTVGQTVYAGKDVLIRLADGDHEREA